jgi:cell division protein FtsA
MKGQRTVVEFGTSKIACASAIQKERAGLQILGYVQIPYSGIKNANWADSNQVSEVLDQALSELEKQVGARIRMVDVGLPGCFTKIVSSTAQVQVKGRVTDRDIDALNQKANDISLMDDQVIVGQYPSCYLLDDGEIYLDAQGLPAKSVTAAISFILANKYFLDDVKMLLRNAGVRLDNIICEPLAQTLILIPQEKRDSIAILVDIGYYNTNISLVYGDSVIYLKTVEMGGGHITSDIAYMMKVDLLTAEQLKRRYSFGLQENNNILHLYAKDKTGRLKKFPYDLLKNIIDARVEHIIRYVSGFMSNAERKLGKKLLLYITGGGISYMPGASSFVRTVSGRIPGTCKVENSVLSAPSSQTIYALLDFSFKYADMGRFLPEEEKKGFFSKVAGKLFE